MNKQKPDRPTVQSGPDLNVKRSLRNQESFSMNRKSIRSIQKSTAQAARVFSMALLIASLLLGLIPPPLIEGVATRTTELTGFENLSALTDALPQPAVASAAPAQQTITTVTITDLIDGEENEADGSVSTSSTDLELDLDTGFVPNRNQIAGITFFNLPLLQGATVTDAYIQFTAASDSSASQTLTIWGHDIGDSPGVTSANVNDISARTKTTASVSWNVDGTWIAGETGAAQRTPSLMPIINEILARGDFGYGDEMTFIIDGNGTTRHNVESEEGGIGPQLVIELEAVTATLDTFEDTNGDNVHDAGEANQRTSWSIYDADTGVLLGITLFPYASGTPASIVLPTGFNYVIRSNIENFLGQYQGDYDTYGKPIVSTSHGEIGEFITLGTLTSDTTVRVGFFAPTDSNPAPSAADENCYLVSDGYFTGTTGSSDGFAQDTLVNLTLAAGSVTSDVQIGANGATGKFSTEASAFDPRTDTLYAGSSNDFGAIDTATGIYSELAEYGAYTLNGGGAATISDVDGIAYDPVNQIWFGIERTGDEALGIVSVPDRLFVFDPAQAPGNLIVTGYFGGNDYVDVVAPSGNTDLTDIDDLTFNPVTGQLLGIANLGGSSTRIVDIDTATGATTDLGIVAYDPDGAGPIGEINVLDVEGIAYSPTGALYGVTGQGSRFFEIDTTASGGTLTATLITRVNNGDPLLDFESLTCNTFPLVEIGDFIWLDTDGDGNQNEVGTGIENVVVNLLAPDGSVAYTTTTDASGIYGFSGLPATIAYTVTVAAENFTGSGALVGYQQSADPDSTLDNTGTSAILDGVAETQDLTLDFGFAPVGTITVVKNTVGSDGTFTFSSTDADLNGLSVPTLVNTGSSATITKTIGTYTITEDILPATWSLTDIVVSGTDGATASVADTANSRVVINLDADDAVVVTFTNTEQTDPCVDHTTNNRGTLSAVSDAGKSSDEVSSVASVQIETCIEYDYGDLPDGSASSPSGLPTNSPGYNTDITGTVGASHVITPGLYLGSLVDNEIDGQPSINATGDDTVTSTLGYGTGVGTADDEDGIALPSVLVNGATTLTNTFVAGETATITASVLHTGTGDATVYAFIDWNGDGSFDDANEAISTTVASNAAAQSVVLTVNVPADADITQQLGARFRLSTDTGLGADGAASDGEVEDYLIEVLRYVSLGNRVWYDLDDDGLQDASENGIANVQLELLDSSGNAITDTVGNPITTTTDASGFYTFTNLISGTYTVRVSYLNFATGGVLEGLNSSSTTEPNPEDDDNSDDNGQDNVNAADATTGGVTSGPIVVTPGSEPNSDGDGTDGNLTVDFGFVAYDWGDLPDSTVGSNYATGIADNGARHAIAEGVFLGASVDSEGDGQPNTAASGDDGAGVTPDDEDGVTLSDPVAGQTMQITVTSSISGYLSAWIDWDGDGTLDPIDYTAASGGTLTGAGSMAALLLPTDAGDIYVFDVTVPAAITNTIYSRFRFTTDATWSPSVTGTAPDGEVEDHAIASFKADWGDLPDIYTTLLATGGANHIITDTIFLGAGVDNEVDGQPNSTADGDDNSTSAGVGGFQGDDEDGITFLTPLMPGQTADIEVVVGGTSDGFLNVFIDFDGDGVLDPVTIAGVPIDDLPVTNGVNNITIDVPAVVSDTIYSRFRLTVDADEADTAGGQATTGEVEDYVLMSLGNRVWLDNGLNSGTSNNGVQDGGEVGIAGVEVQLQDATGTTVIATTTTDADGFYTFTGLISDTYVVHIPATEFGVGALLESHLSSTDSGFVGLDPDTDADDLDDNGVDSADPSTSGISSAPVTLSYGDEPDVATDGNGPNANFTVDFGFVSYDWGDLPDGATLNSPNYNTNNIAAGINGAIGPSHAIVPGLQIGAVEDAETNGQPTTTADGDDLDGTDDEEGVTFSNFIAGQTASITVTVLNTTGVNGVLYSFIDFDGDGSFDDPGEAIETPVTDGTNGTVVLSVPVPVDADTSQQLGARFRLSTDTALGADGPATNGEVEDYLIDVVAYDWGDLPDDDDATGASTTSPGYNTNITGTVGASHVITPGLYLGTVVDAEGIGQASAAADGDDTNLPANADDEDSVTFPTFMAGETVVISVTAVNTTGTAATLYAFIDFDGDGAFISPGEALTVDVPDGTNGPVPLTVVVPVDAVTTEQLGARLRLSTDVGLTEDGPASDGEVEDYLIDVIAVDFGDLPDADDATGVPATSPGYNTNITGTAGASHIIIPGLTIGTDEDAEVAGQASAAADGDDNNGTMPDDEDGVTLPANFIAGATQVVTVTVNNTTGTDATVYGFIDFNGDGDFGDTGETVSVSGVSGTAQPVALSFSVPVDADTTQDLGARFRLSTDAGLTADGAATNGEVEDYLTKVIAYDWGDLPDDDSAAGSPTSPGYNTDEVTTVSGGIGASHVITSGLIIGSIVDPEGTGQPSAAADGDDTNLPTAADDEDGITLPVFVVGQNATITATVVNTTATAATLYAFIDFDGDGLFTTPGEALDVPVPIGFTGDVSITFAVPTNAVVVGDLGARFRLSTEAGLGADGPAADGEVEDYLIQVVQPVSLGDLVWFDKDADGIQEPDGADATPGNDDDEVGIQGARVELFAADGVTPATDLFGDPVLAQTTSITGSYQFTNLLPGDYIVQVTPPAGYALSPNDQVGTDQTDSDGVQVGTVIQSPVVNLAVGAETADGDTDDNNDPTIDFGFYQPLSLGNYVWHDVDADGVQGGATDVAIPGATVELFATTDGGTTLTAATDVDGAAVPAETTDTAGFYLFENLPPGDYVVRVTPPAGYAPTNNQVADPEDNSNTDTNIDNTRTAAAPAGSYESGVITLSSGNEPDGTPGGVGDDDGDTDANSNLTVDFGFAAFDLALRKTVASTSDTPLVPGTSTVTFNIEVINQGQITANQVIVTDAALNTAMFDVFDQALNPDVAPYTWNAAGEATITGPLAPGATVIVPITLQVAAAATQGDTLENYAEIVSATDNNDAAATDIDSTPEGIEADDNADPLVDNVIDDGGDTDEDDHDVAYITVDAFDLALVKTLSAQSDTTLIPGTSTVTFTIEIFNQGDVTATESITVVDYVDPAMFTIDDGNWTLGDANEYERLLTADIGPGGSITTTITLQIAANTAGATLTNLAEIAGDGQPMGADIDSTPDSINGNGTEATPVDNMTAEDGKNGGDEDDHDIAEVIVPIFDLALVKTVNSTSDTPLIPGVSTVTFDITVYNQGTVTATQIAIKDYLSDFGTFDNSGNGWSAVADGYETTLVGSLAPGQAITKSITLNVPTTATGTINNYAEITAAQDESGNDATDIDSNPDPTNGEPTDGVVKDNFTAEIFKNPDGSTDPTQDEDDHDIAQVTVGAFDLALVKSISDAGADPVLPGDKITFTIEIFNQGDITATAPISIVDYVQTGFTFNTADNTAALTGNANDWDGTDTALPTYAIASDIAPGKSTTVDIVLEINTGTAGQTLQNKAEISDDGAPTDIDSTPDANDTEAPVKPGETTEDGLGNPGVDDEDDHDLVEITVSEAVALGNFVWFDQLADGQQGGADDTPLEGATVELFVTTDGGATLTAATDIDGVAIVSATTVADGLYEFSNLAPGEYVVQVTPPAGYAVTMGGGDPDDNNNTDSNGQDIGQDYVQSLPVLLSVGDEPAGDEILQDGIDENGNGTVDFGFFQPVSIGDLVWYDADADGTQDGGTAEPGLAGALVELFADDGVTPVVDAFGLPVTAQTTGASGLYSFTNLLPGSYVVQVIPPSGYELSPLDAVGSTDETDSDGTQVGPVVQSPVTALAVGAEIEPVTNDGNDNYDSTVDFGFYQPVSVGDLVWVDPNADGTQDDAEPVLGAVVELFAADGTTPVTDIDGNTVAPQTTGLDGLYHFDNLTPGDYVVQVTPPRGHVPTPTQVADPDNDDNGDSNIDTASATAPAGSYQSGVVTLAAGTEPDGTPDVDGDTDPNSNLSVDFGFVVFDLALRKTVASTSNTPLIPGASTVTFDIAVINQGNITATNVSIVDFVQTGFTFNAQTGWDGTVPTAPTYAVTGEIAPGATVTVQVTLDVDASVAPGTTLENYAEIATADDSNGNSPATDVDSTPENVEANTNGDPLVDNEINDDGDIDEDDADIAMITVDSFDLALVKRLSGQSETPINPGTTLVTYTIEVFNQGDVDLTDSISIVDYAQAGLTFELALNTAALTGNGNDWLTPVSTPTLVIDDDITAGGSVTVDIVLRVDAGTQGETLYNFAEIASDGQLGDADPDSTPDSSNDEAVDPLDPTDDVVKDGETAEDGQNSATDDEDDHDVATIEVPTFDLALVKTVASTSDTPLVPGSSTVTFDITVYNQGDISARNVEIVDYIVAGDYTYNPALNPDWSQAATTTPTTTLAGPLTAGMTVTKQIVLNVAAGSAGTQVENYAEIVTAEDANGNTPADVDSTSDNTNGETPVKDNFTSEDALTNPGVDDEDDHDIATLTVGSFDLALIKRLSDAVDRTMPILPNDIVTFTIEIFNQGDITATAPITVVDYVQAGFTFDPANNGTWDGTDPSNPLYLLTNDIAPGQSDTVQIVLTVDAGTAGDTLYNFAEIAGDGPETDPDSAPDSTNDEAGVDPLDPTDDAVKDDVTLEDGLNVVGEDEDDHDVATIDVSQPVTVGNYIWIDANVDGVQDVAETALENAVVALFVTTDGGATLVAASDIDGVAVISQTTLADGLYEFGNLAPGEYVVRVTPPTGYALTSGGTDPDDDDNTDSNGVAVAGQDYVDSLPVLLEVDGEPTDDDDANADDNNSNQSVDFGFFTPVSLGDLVWFDQNIDGTQDATEPGLANVRVELYEVDGVTPAVDVNGDPVLAATTDVSGTYAFTNLVPGEYVVQIVPPAGYASTVGGADPDNNDNTDSNGIPVGDVIQSLPISLTVSSETGDGRSG